MAGFNNLINYTYIASHSLTANRLRSFLSILGVVFGVVSVIIIISTGEGTKQETLRRIEQLGTKNIYVKASLGSLQNRDGENFTEQIWSFPDKEDYQRIIQACAGIRVAACVRELSVKVAALEGAVSPSVLAVSSEYARLLELSVRSGRFIASMDTAQQHLVCVLGKDIAKALGNSGHIGGIVRIGGIPFSVVGIIDRESVAQNGKSAAFSVRDFNHTVMVPLGVERWLVDSSKSRQTRGNQWLSELIFQVASQDLVFSVARRIQEIMENRESVTTKAWQIVVPLELLRQSKKANEEFSLFLLALASVSLLVGGIGIMNIMLATVSERRQEIGIRRAVGAQKKHILLQFLLEAVVLTSLGGFLGVCLGMAALWGLAFAGLSAVLITPKAIVLPLVVSSLTGVAAGMYPAWQASCVDPVTALHR